jgi:hypothetical protein
MKQAHSQIECLAAALAGYAERGVFKGFNSGRTTGDKTTFRIVWHRNQVFDLTVDLQNASVRFPRVLTNVPADSDMYAELKQFIKSRHADELPEHRRIDRGRASVQSYNRGGNVSLVMKVKDGDYEYAVRKFIHLVHEIFMTFLVDGSYHEYMVETFDLDPDRM